MSLFPGLRKEATSSPPTCASSWLGKWSEVGSQAFVKTLGLSAESTGSL